MYGERREKGVVEEIKEGFGFMRWKERDKRIFLKLNEVLDVECEISVGEEVEFNVVKDK